MNNNDFVSSFMSDVNRFYGDEGGARFFALAVTRADGSIVGIVHELEPALALGAAAWDGLKSDVERIVATAPGETLKLVVTGPSGEVMKVLPIDAQGYLANPAAWGLLRSFVRDVLANDQGDGGRLARERGLLGPEGGGGRA